MTVSTGSTGSTGSARPLLLVAASGLAREVAEVARSTGREVLGLVDDDERLHGSEPVPGLVVLGGLDLVAELAGAALVLCAGRGRSRQAIARRLAAMGVGPERYGTVVDPSVRVPSSATLGRGVVLLSQVVLTADVELGDHVVVMPHVVLTHDCRVGSYATLCAGVVLGGGVTVGSCAYIGMSASVREGLTVGAGSVVGMGSVVLADVPVDQTWAGTPARRLSAQEGSAPPDRRPGTGATG